LRPKLLIATTNSGKMREYRMLLKGVPYHLVSLSDAGVAISVTEAGKTFEENACLKAQIIAQESQLLTLADDSGLEVDALGGEPGVMSARYAGENATDAERVSYLLAKLTGIAREKRTARFRCVIAVARPGGSTEICDGECHGFIATEPHGKNGFGYDPIFLVPELGKTIAELPVEIKNRISHRGRAAKKARRLLNRMARESA
jgi:XTP/dITP diphosphohydrolase